MLERKKEISQLVIALHGLRSEESSRTLLKLCELMVDEIRTLNDFVTPERLPHNQGKIEAFSEIAKWINFGIPKFNMERPLSKEITY